MPDPGYYSALFQDMLAINQDRRENTLMQQRQQGMAMQQQEMALKNQERSLMMQAFKGSSDLRGGMQDATDLDAQAKKLQTIAARIMPLDPARATQMMKAAGELQSRKGQQDSRNIQNAIRLNERRGEIAIGVTDQASLDQAVQDMVKEGIPPPPVQYRKWGTPETAKYWEGLARTSKRYLDDLRVKDQELSVKLRQEALDEQKRKNRAAEAEKDRKDALSRYNVLRKEMPDKPGYFASDEDKAAFKERQAELETARKAAFGGGKAADKAVSMDLASDPEAASIKADFTAGKITKEQALEQLRELGYE